MATYVLVHGAWSGSHVFRPVRLLRDALVIQQADRARIADELRGKARAS